MRPSTAVVAVFVASLAGAIAAPARAADPSLVADFERRLAHVEKAVLASLLIDPAHDADFTADMHEVRKDPPARDLVLAKWRLQMAQFALANRAAPNPDLEATYRNYPEILSPAVRAYLARRLRDLRERGASDPDARDAYETMRGYLSSVQSSLNDKGKLSWYTKKVVAGIFDKYRAELVEFLGTENARAGLRDGPAAARELQQRRAAAELAAREEAERRRLEQENAAAPTPAPGGKPARRSAPRKTEPPLVAVETPAQRTAREQAEAAERLARRGRPGQVFDGGGAQAGAPGVPVDVPGDTAAPRAGGLTPPALVPSALVGPRVSPPALSAEDELLTSIKGPVSGGSKSWKEYTPQIGGAALGALIGFFSAGPIGALFGAVLGLIAGDAGARMLFK